MKRPELFHKTIDILVKAFFNDTLNYLDPCACGVGNLVAANMGYEVKKPGRLARWFNERGVSKNNYWISIFIAGKWVKEHYRCLTVKEKGLEELNSTGYTPLELFNLERAMAMTWDNDLFQNNPTQAQFDALMGIVDYLCDLHEVDKEDKDLAVAKFESCPRLVEA